MLYVDVKYAKMLNSRLSQFKIKKLQPLLINFRCPSCGDSKKDKTKARAYLYEHNNKIMFSCHNCNAPISFSSLLKMIDPIMHDEWVMENFKNSNTKYKPVQDDSIFKESGVDVLLSNSILTNFQSAIDVPIALKYLESRKIPSDKYNSFYYTEAFKETTNTIKPNSFETTKFDHSRLIIPFYNEESKVFAYQGRSFGNEIPKYITIKIDDDAEKIFGMNTVNLNKPVFVLEGPIDSLFLDNCIAVAGSSLDIPYVHSIKDKIIIPDNEPRNNVVNKQIEKYVNLGWKVVFFPDSIREKDINDIILSGVDKDELQRIISNNIYQGLQAKLKFAQWRK